MNKPKQNSLDPESENIIGSLAIAAGYFIIVLKINSDIKAIKSLIGDDSINIDERIASLRNYQNEFQEWKQDLENIMAETDFGSVSLQEYAAFNQFHIEITNIVTGIENAINNISDKEKEAQLNQMQTLVNGYAERLDIIEKGHIKLKKVRKHEKIVWRGKASHLAYLFIELAEKGFIELPSTSGEGSYSKLGMILFELFDADTTVGNLSRECNPNFNSLTNPNRAKFSIPHLSDM